MQFIFIRDWARPDRLWGVLLLPGNRLLLSQGAYRNGQCEFLFSVFPSIFSMAEPTSIHMVDIFLDAPSDTFPVRFGFNNWSEIDYASSSQSLGITRFGNH
jgi:hypothetical protein